MNHRETYKPGAAAGAKIQKNDGDQWTLVVSRDLRHAPPKVWRALTDPEHLREWAPFDSDRSLETPGATKLTTVGAPKPQVNEGQVKLADAPKVLEFSWGDQDLRWELQPLANGGTHLTLSHHVDRRYIAMSAAGWHVCLDVLDRFLADEPTGRIVGPDTLKLDGWQQLHAEYAKQFGVVTPAWDPSA
jgi:uncharacterized protein YndB with AHSA1/START domain